METHFKKLDTSEIFTLAEIYRNIDREMLKTVFFDIEKYYFGDFLDLIRTRQVYACYTKDEPLGLYWFDNHEYNSMRAHILLVGKFNRDTIFLAKHALRSHLDNSINTITCIVPTINNKMVRFAKLLGFQFHKEMKGYYNHSDAIFGYLN